MLQTPRQHDSDFGLDRAVVQLIILDVASGNRVDPVQLSGRGVLSLYGGRPATLLLAAGEEYCASLVMTAG